MRVRDLMTREPVLAEIPGTRDDVLRLFLRHDVSGFPVVREGTRELAGVVTRTDVFRDADERQLALLMTPDPVTVGPDADIGEAATVLASRRIRTLVVVDGAEVVGVVSPSDVLRTFTNGQLTVADVAPQGLVAVHEATPLAVAWTLLKANRANALPVLGDDGRLSGIVADGDLFKHAEVDERFRIEALGNAREDDTWMWDRMRSILPLWLSTSRVKLPLRPVSDVMSREPVTVYKGASVADAARRMAARHVNQLPVVDADDQVVGVVSDLDLVGGRAREAAPAPRRAARA